jgi:hypothetical protein
MLSNPVSEAFACCPSSCETDCDRSLMSGRLEEMSIESGRFEGASLPERCRAVPGRLPPGLAGLEDIFALEPEAGTRRCMRPEEGTI